MYRELAFVLEVLCSSTSNAVAERVFSIMNATKTKIRNRMQLKLLNAILRIKITLYSKKKCCKDFQATDSMVQDFNSKIMYQSKEAEEAVNREEELEVIDMLSEHFDIPCISII